MLKSPVRAAIYVRISRDAQGEALGVQRQEDDCRLLAAALGWEVIEVFADNDISASSRSRKARPGYARLLAAIDSGRVQAVLAYSTSRLTRRPREFEGLIERVERGLRIACANTAGEVDLSTADGRAVARTLAAFDAREAEVNAERKRRQVRQYREQGRWSGGQRPFGWDRTGVAHDPAEAELLREAYADVLAGRSLGTIARRWNAAGIATVQGGQKWISSTVGYCLRLERHRGVFPGTDRVCLPPIVDEATWRGAVAVLNAPGRLNRHHGPARLLTGIATCGLCGATVHGGTKKQAGKLAAKPTYRCSRVKHLDRLCCHPDEFVTGVVLAWLARERIPAPGRAGAGGADSARLAAEAAGLRARRAELLELVGVFSPAEIRRKAAELDAELDAVETRLAAASASGALAGLPLGREELVAWWEAADSEQRRAVLLACQELAGLSVVLHPPGRGAQVFRPETVEITWTGQTCATSV
jgi:site-specific DNA recombinase